MEIITAKKLRKVFKNGVELVALDDVDLTIDEGEFLAITGPSGSGKSTLLNMLGLLDTPSGGEIRLKGRDLSNANSKERSKLRNKELLKDVGLFERMDHKPSALSGGQSQRVAVARALANRPSIVIGDEPTGNLDSKNSEMVYEMLRRLNREINQTFILVTHDINMARKTDRILRLVDGKIVSEMRREGDKFVEHL